MPRKFVFEFSRAPGDVLMLTALVRDLKLTYGRDVQIDVRTPFPGIWRHNPYLTPLTSPSPGVQHVFFHKPKVKAADSLAVHRSKKGHGEHYVTAFHRSFTERTGLAVEPLFPFGDIHLSAEEKNSPLLSGRYWIVVPGGKTDMTNKWWLDRRWQQVVDSLREQGVPCVQEGSTKPIHDHKPLNNVRDLIGLTSIRDLIVNIYHADGVICGCTFQMHIAGALQKPCVMLLGGREEPSFEAYSNDYNAFGPKAQKIRVPHRVLHTIGQLSCCQTGGCWRRRVEPLNDWKHPQDRFARYDRSLCQDVVRNDEDPAHPRCMSMITADQVVAAAMSYYDEGYLSPLPPAMPGLPEFLRESELQSELRTGQPRVVAVKPTAPASSSPAGSDKVTLFLLLFGDDAAMHRRCLQAVSTSTTPAQRELRIIANQVGDETRRLVETSGADLVYWNGPDVYKFQAMRQAFHDPKAPITTSWVVWLDDVACPRRPDWLKTLTETAAKQPRESRVGLLGEKLSHILVNSRGQDPRDWFRRGDWFGGKSFRNRQGTPTGNGNCVHYASANFFAVSRQAIQQCGLPDARLRQSGGGVVIGEQLHQQGFQIKAFNGNGDYVHVSQPARQRGLKEDYPWT